ncbi:Alpha/Beta hydrolase protein [Cladorrhinum samala]|uniref:Alpha/Beta hydrolase protein n=1 Tax=Cladorrhinum samala TaxID=585594 RepID=A0AAV9HRV3_9PEZI|nr:Alpha/Beta hydrolase protein [Cladorrhinum samala]
MFLKFFKSNFYNFETTRLLSSTSTGGCEIGEFLEATGKAKQHDPESWYAAWHEQSVRAEGIAHDAARNGQRNAARRAFIRASNYARASGYMLSWSREGDARVLQSAERAVSLFRKSMPYMDGHVKVLEIPYDHADNANTKAPLSAYLYLPSQSNRLSSSPRGQGQRDTPVIINCNGADSTQEELYHGFVAPGLELGYAVLTFEGPGQGMMLKKHKTAMRPDFEVVTARVLDHLESIVTTATTDSPELSRLDLNRVAIVGVSMGGYYALRAAMDPRIKACVSVDPFYGLWRLALTRMPAWYAALWTSGWLPESAFNASVYAQMAVDFPTRWEFELGMAMMGTSTPGDTLRRFQQFDLDVVSDHGNPRGASVVDRIRCPVFVTGAGSTSIYASADESTLKIFKGLSALSEDKKEVWIPEEVGAGGLSGKVGAWSLLAQRSFEFLDKHLGIQREGIEG